MSDAFLPGDVVQLNSGGTKMSVRGPGSYYGTAPASALFHLLFRS